MYIHSPCTGSTGKVVLHVHLSSEFSYIVRHNLCPWFHLVGKIINLKWSSTFVATCNCFDPRFFYIRLFWIGVLWFSFRASQFFKLLKYMCKCMRAVVHQKRKMRRATSVTDVCTQDFCSNQRIHFKKTYIKL